MGEAAGGVERDRRWFGAADHRHHRAESGRFGSLQQGIEQRAADAAALCGGVDIDAVLARPGIGGARPELAGIGVAENRSLIVARDEEGPAPCDMLPDQRCGRFGAARFGIVTRGAVRDMMRIDGGDPGGIAGRGRNDGGNGGHAKAIAATRLAR